MTPRISKSRTCVRTTAGLALLAWLGSGAHLAAADNTPVVRVSDCAIKLIDRVILASDRAGILAFVEPAEGDFVQADDLVAKLSDEVAAAALAVAAKQAENDVEIRYATKAAEVAKAEHDKAIIANKSLKGTFPEIEVQRLHLAAERSVLQIEQAEHQLEVNKLTRNQAAAELAAHRVKAPFDGVVTRVYKAMGEAVRQGDPILELASTDRVRVEGYLPIRDVWRVKRGARVRVRMNIPGVELDEEREEFEGRIAFVDVTAQPVTLVVRVWAEVANTENVLRAGLNADMTIFPDERVPPERVSGR